MSYQMSFTGILSRKTVLVFLQEGWLVSNRVAIRQGDHPTEDKYGDSTMKTVAGKTRSQKTMFWQPTKLVRMKTQCSTMQPVQTQQIPMESPLSARQYMRHFHIFRALNLGGLQGLCEFPEILCKMAFMCFFIIVSQ